MNCPTCGKRGYEPGEITHLTTSSPEVMAVVREVTLRHGFTLEELGEPSREYKRVLARDDLTWRLRKELDLTLVMIGTLIHRDHTSVIASLRKTEARLARDKLLAAEA